MHSGSIRDGSEILLVFCACPDEETAAGIAETLVRGMTRRLRQPVACRDVRVSLAKVR